MKKRSSRWGCLLGVVLILVVLLLGGGWWLYRMQAPVVGGSADATVLVTITSPLDADEVSVGDFVAVFAQAVAPGAIQSMELFLDGQSLGKVANSPSGASWTWQAWPLGIHSLYVQATDAEEQVGYSQVILINVLAGDGSMQVIAGESQTLEQIGSSYGVPADQMASANPKVDPSQPLPDGKLVQVPVGESENGSAGGSGQGGEISDPLNILITWSFQPKEPVDKSYCYTSTGSGIWEKIPKPPFNFLDGFNPYTQFKLIFPNQKSVIQVQCWGWLGTVLKFLGQGETPFDVLKPPGEMKIDGGGFVLTGIPKVPPIKEDQFLDNEIKSVPPPFALREPKDSKECQAHGNLIITPFICDNLMNAKVKQYLILEWEWAPKFCWPGPSCQWYDKVDGYRIYEFDPSTMVKKLVRDEKSQGNKVTAIPLPWGPKCYLVEAYVNQPGVPSSVAASYCPGDEKYGSKITLTNVAEWLTTEDVLKDGDDCAYTQGYMLQNNGLPGFGSQAGEVFVGAGILEKDQSVGIPYCFMDEYYQGGIKFNMTTQIPINAVIQKAVLRFTRIYQVYGGGAKPGPTPSSCVLSVTGADQSWSAMIDSDHWVKGALPYGGQSVSVNSYGSTQADVTSIVANWLKNPSSNHGFVLRGWFPALPTDDEESSSCISALNNFQLEIYYFAAP